MQLSAQERRASRRYRVHVAVAIDTPIKPGRVGISHDMSTTGIRFNTRSRFAPGDEVTLTLHLSDAYSDATRVRAKVVRTESVEMHSSYPWRYLTAVEFDEPVPELESSAKQRAALPI
jgi:hypothetical protein